VVDLARAGAPPPEVIEAPRFHERAGDHPHVESIYLLLVEEDGDLVPVYIGRTKDPVKRWAQHLKGLHQGERLYARWRQALLTPTGRVRQALKLVIIPVSDIRSAPLPNFPTSTGALEYQLVSIASEAYPGRLLNHEGNRR